MPDERRRQEVGSVCANGLGIGLAIVRWKAVPRTRVRDELFVPAKSCLLFEELGGLDDRVVQILAIGGTGVREYWRRQWAEIDPVVMPTAFAQEADGRVRVTVHSLVRDRAGQVLAEHVVEHVYTFEDGLVRAMEIRLPA